MLYHFPFFVHVSHLPNMYNVVKAKWPNIIDFRSPRGSEVGGVMI